MVNDKKSACERTKTAQTLVNTGFINGADDKFCTIFLSKTCYKRIYIESIRDIYIQKHKIDLLMMNKKQGEITMLNAQLKSFFIHCYSMNLQPNTITTYESKLKVFTSYLNNHTDIDEPSEITSETVREFLTFHRQRVSKNTIRQYYNVLNVFFRFLAKEKIIQDNIMENVYKPKVSKRQIRSFSNTEVNMILKHFDRNTFVGFRNYAIMITLFATGIRISELCGLQAVDIMFELNVINIIGKGDKQRKVPMSENLRKILLKYFKMRNEYIDEKQLYQSRYFFITKKATPMTRDNIEWLFIRIRQYYNLDVDRFSPHTFRHTFAKNYLLNGGDIFSLQRILGHNNLETTKQYISLNDREVKVQNDKYNPLDNQRWKYQ